MRDAALILHFIGLAMGLGTSFAMMFLGIASSVMEKNEAGKFMTNALSLSKMGNIGLVVLFVSGGYLATDLFANILSDSLFLAKMILFLVLGALLGIIGSNAKKAKAADDPTPILRKITGIGRLTMIVGLAIVILAVLRFH